MIAFGFSRSATSVSCGPENDGVQEQRVRAELGAGDDRLDEAAVVAGHDRDVVALVDAVVGERVRERVRALVDLAERQLPELVDDRDLVGVARGGGARSRRPACAPAHERSGRCAASGPGARSG